MLERWKQLIARFWPVLRLRTILFGVLMFVAALPGISAIFLAVYENALVRRTEAELIAQSAAIGASAALLWPGQSRTIEALPEQKEAMDRYGLKAVPSTGIDLRASPILEERPAPRPRQALQQPTAQEIASQLVPVIAETQTVTLASIILMDNNGTVLTGVWRDQSLAHVPEVALALRGTASTTLRHNASYQARTVLEIFSRAAAIRLHHARPIKVNGQVVGVVLASRSPRALMRGMYEDRGKIALGVALIFATLIGLTAVLVRTIVRPIEALSAASRALANGTPIKPQGSRLQVVEIATLFDDFDTMATSIERRSAYLKDFAAAVSHEFKTPLAAINGAIELLSDHGSTMSEAQRQQFLDNMGADTERLSKLVRRLLDLARADLQVIDPSARADVKAICHGLEAALKGQQLTLAFFPSETPIIALIDAAVLESVLGSLVDNAIQAGATDIALSVHRAADIKISVANNGPAIVAADQQRIFEPFFTSKRASGGTGMGLSIARSLLTPYGGSLTLATPPPSYHVCFDVTVPAALIG